MADSKKYIILTGGSRGIGRAIAEVLLQNHDEILITGKNEKQLAKATKDLSSFGTVDYYAFNLANRVEIEDFVNEWNKPLYGLVNNAGVVKVENISDFDTDTGS